MSRLPRWVRRFATPVIILWLLLAGVLNVFVPQLEQVVAEHSPAFLDKKTKGAAALYDMAERFNHGDSNNVIYLLLEGEQPLGESARVYYAQLIAALKKEPTVNSVSDLWSDPVTASANESVDKKAVYVQVWLKGDMGKAESLKSIAAVEDLLADIEAPAGVKTYLTGMPVVIAGEIHSADRDIFIISGISFVLILVLLLLVYRRFITAIIPLISVGVALLVARPVIGLLGLNGIVEASLFASALSAALILGAGTDYTIFFIGRYHEGRNKGYSKGRAYYQAYSGVNHIVVASALTIAGACACLSFTQITVLQTAGIPSAIGILVGLAAALTLTPAIITVGSRLGYLDPKPGLDRRSTWRRFGTAVVRWPVPLLVASFALLLGLMAIVSTIRINYDEVSMQPENSPDIKGLKVFDKHFPANQAAADLITLRSDHDLRNPKSAVVIEQVSKALEKLVDVRAVQSISRPTGKLLPESLLVNQAGLVGTQLEQSATLLQGSLADMKKLNENLTNTVTSIDKMQAEMAAAGGALGGVNSSAAEIAAGAKQAQASMRELAATITPLRNLVNNRQRCAAAGLFCSAAYSVVSYYDNSPIPPGIAGINRGVNGAADLSGNLGTTAQSLQDAISGLTGMRQNLVEMNARTTRSVTTMEQLLANSASATDYLREIGKNFGANESGIFYLPQQVFADSRFKVALENFFTADGHTTRILVYGKTSSFSASGINRAEEIQRVAVEALKATSLEGAVVQTSGVGASFADIKNIINRDFRLLVIVTFIFVFVVVLVVLRSLVAALIVVGTVAISFGSALGLSVLIWQYLLEIELHWATPPFVFIALVAVGSDYNLLLTARVREEVYRGLRTGIIKAYTDTGSVVTSAGIVFAITMFAMLGSSLTNIVQLGTTVGLGLLVDTFIVRAIVVPAIASHLGVWFWWPITRKELLTVQEKQ